MCLLTKGENIDMHFYVNIEFSRGTDLPNIDYRQDVEL